MVKIPHFQFRECGFDPWSGNQDPICHMPWTKERKYKLFSVFSKPFAIDIYFYFGKKKDNKMCVCTHIFKNYLYII